jgi:hypothetical protein
MHVTVAEYGNSAPSGINSSQSKIEAFIVTLSSVCSVGFPMLLASSRFQRSKLASLEFIGGVVDCFMRLLEASVFMFRFKGKQIWRIL